MIKWAILCAYLATIASAATKRDEFGGAANSPIYGSSAPSSVQSGAPSSSNYNYNSYPSSYGSSPSAASGVAGVSGPYQAVDQSQGAASNVGVGSYGSGQGSSANNQGNLYYYYYPVGDKAKGQDAQGYQMASSNQYPSLSAANPMASESNQHASVDSSSSSQDLSYSQDFNQNVGQGMPQIILCCKLPRVKLFLHHLMIVRSFFCPPSRFLPSLPLFFSMRYPFRVDREHKLWQLACSKDLKMLIYHSLSIPTLIDD